MLRLLPASASCTNLVPKNQFRELNWNLLTISLNLTVWSHRLSTVGDALRPVFYLYGPSNVPDWS